MFNRRTFLSLAAGGITAPRLASAQQASRKVALYANVGADLTHYDVDVASAGAICLAAHIETLSICRIQQ